MEAYDLIEPTITNALADLEGLAAATDEAALNTIEELKDLLRLKPWEAEREKVRVLRDALSWSLDCSDCYCIDLEETECSVCQGRQALAATAPKNRVTVEVTTECGNSWKTEINTDLKGAREYFMGQRFTNADESKMGPVVKVEEVKP